MKKALRLSSLAVLLMAVIALVSCAPKDLDSATKKMEKKGYNCVEDKLVVPTALKLAKVDVEACFVATKEGETVTAILFADKKTANDSYDAVKQYAEDHGAKSEAKKSGKWIYYGTEQAMKDFA